MKAFFILFVSLGTLLFGAPIHDAVEAGDMAKLKALIGSKSDVNTPNAHYQQTALHLAVYN